MHSLDILLANMDMLQILIFNTCFLSMLLNIYTYLLGTWYDAYHYTYMYFLGMLFIITHIDMTWPC